MRTRFGFPSALLHGRWRPIIEEHRQLFLALAVAVSLITVSAVAGGVWFVASIRSGLPNKDAIGRMGNMSEATLVYDASDKLAFTIFAEQRIDVALADISPSLISAILAIEDQRFYDHHGFDAFRIASAALVNVRRGRAAQGGSTITQQLARQSFLTTDKTIRRKLQELILAERIEWAYEKPQILELYLNKVYFGDGLYGVETAARGYFGKHASELSLAEAALLAGLVKSPSAYAPTTNLARAIARRNVVLQAMLDNGVIDRHAWQQARTAAVVLRDGLRASDPRGQYFKEQLRQDLVERFGWERVYQGGLRVYSTIDMSMQESAEASVAQSLKALDEKRQAQAGRRPQAAAGKDETGPLQAAVLAMDPRTGHVRAMVGGRDFGESHFNRAVQARRQPGSAFKPFVYAAALEAGYTPATIIDHLNDPIATPQGAWTPEEGHAGADSMSLRAALRTSSNRAAVRLLQQVGIPQTVQYAKNMGVGDVPSVPSLALGSGEVTLQSLTAAYAAFANHGLVPTPLMIRRVESSDGDLLYTSEVSTVRAISDTTAFLMSTMLADVINAGTGAGARRYFTLPAAGKTGTTNEYNDAWFVGFTPNLVAGVWVGFDQPRTIMARGFAAEVAVPLWARFMKTATQGDKPQWLGVPPGITTASVCRLSGKLATDECQHSHVDDEDGSVNRRPPVYNEYFARGTEPTEYCDLHKAGGFLGVLASIFHGGGEPPPPPPRAVEIQPPSAMAAAENGSVAPAPAADELPKRKRGFWSKLFGKGKDDKD